MRKVTVAILLSIQVLSITVAIAPLQSTAGDSTDQSTGAALALAAAPAPRLQITPTAPTGSTGGPATEPVRGRPPLWLTLFLLGMCCIMALVVGIFVLGIMARSQNARAVKEDNESTSD